MTVEVQSYASIGLRLWAAAKAPHGRACPCLICADTRRYLGEPRRVAGPAASRPASSVQ